MRGVKLGRKAMKGSPVAYHWAVKVGDTWYEIKGGKNKRNLVDRKKGSAAPSSAGARGGELVGETNATDKEIDDWIEEWLRSNPDYKALSSNCQKFAYEFLNWLTDGNFSCSHRFNATDVSGGVHGEVYNGFARAEDGNAIARFDSGELRSSTGPLSFSTRSAHVQAQAIAGPGLGAWLDLSTAKMEVSLGNVIGVHAEPNLNTGVGIRNGNLDVHLAGFGGKIGADGIEVDTPLGGVNACSVM